jgi:hypothetical protein
MTANCLRGVYEGRVTCAYDQCLSQCNPSPAVHRVPAGTLGRVSADACIAP